MSKYAPRIETVTIPKGKIGLIIGPGGKTIKEFGTFVEVLPGKDGLVHISELADARVNKVEDVVRNGDVIWVKCIGVNDKGRVKLSRKAAMKEHDQAASGGAALDSSSPSITRSPG